MNYALGKLVVGVMLIVALVSGGIGYALHSLIYKCGERTEQK